MMVPSAGLLLCVAACCFLPLLTVSAGCRSKWKQLRGDITEYKLITVLKLPKITDCLMKSSAAEAYAASFDAESGDCALMQCARGGRDACRKCRHEKDASLPMLWIKDPPKTCWKTFQHRVDGSVSFNRNWSEYVSGFGQGESLNYWMGLEQLHQLTATGVWRVRWEFSDWNDNWYWAENAPFSVGPATDKYRCSMGPLDAKRSSVGQLTTAAFSPNGKTFTTDGLCAEERSAGWWFGYCAFMNPNGIYRVPPEAYSTSFALSYFLNGGVLSGSYSLKTFECLIYNE